jgi:hypothetical protein
MMHHHTLTSRRQLLKFMAASPYVAALGGVASFLQQRPLAQRAGDGVDLLTTPADALNVLDFEETARHKVLPGHWAYMASGVDSDVTLRANRDGYSHIQLRPRRLHDATKVDMRVDLFGTVYASPIFLCPTGGEKSFFADGELAVARATSRGTCKSFPQRPRPASRMSTRRSAVRPGISFTRRAPGKPTSNFCDAWRPPGAR